jgi:hypothetical protein
MTKAIANIFLVAGLVILATSIAVCWSAGGKFTESEGIVLGAVLLNFAVLINWSSDRKSI